MRPVDADTVKDVIAELNENGYDISPSDLAFVRNILLRMPTIEPIRCGECIHHDAEISLCYYHNMHTTDGWFCADGERLVK